VPITHALFTEHSEVNDVIFKTPSIGVTELLKDPAAASVLKYLIVSWNSVEVTGIQTLELIPQITDQPAVRPAKGAQPVKNRKREIVLSVAKPSNKAQEAAVIAWMQVMLNLADLLAKPSLLKPEVRTRTCICYSSSHDRSHES
jgi:hypothetical protein